MTTICYKLNTPITFNKGKTYNDTFLEMYVFNKNEAQKICDELNATATDRVYFVDEQELFDTTGN